MTGGSKYVDYERAASRYQQGRSLPDEVLDRWGAAVRPHLPSSYGGSVHVADVGAGTGIFASAWPRWTASRVVAIEPSAAMVQAGADGVSYVRGSAEALPLRDESADVIWVSTALHHFPDIRAAIAEFDRVLCDTGRVLVRTFLPERSEVTWWKEFPESPRALARFPDLGQLCQSFQPQGFGLAHVEEVLEELRSFAECADWAERMRHADSMLTALTDQEMADGLAALRSTPGRLSRAELSLAVFAKRH